MRFRPAALALTTAVLLAACKHTGTEFSKVPVSAGALSAAYVLDWSPLQAAANALRTSDPRYTIQRLTWWLNNPSNTHDSYSLDNANVEYAHAAGLTGAGQIISIVDNGFRQSHDEFTGKTIWTPGGGSNPGVADHGTTVASIAAGAAGSGSIIGVAPGANLALGSFSAGFNAMTAATQQATSLGAIVQNNSWGIDWNATQSNYQSYFGSAAGSAYIDALKTFSNNGVVVFAASNDKSRSNIDLMAGLPIVVPALKNSFIAAINAVPTTSGQTITSATLISSGCLQAAAWCMAADGSVWGAVSSGDSDYAFGTGSSFAAPQISGAIALLAEAFPGLTAQDLRARLLASANNGFYGHTGYVKFGKVKHGYNNTFGHGFLDLKAALSPIGGSYMPTAAGGHIKLDGPAILSGGAAGNAISRGLAGHDLVYSDGLGGRFDASARMLSADALPQANPTRLASDLLATDLSAATFDPFALPSDFGLIEAGASFAIDLDEAQVTVLLPSEASDVASFGARLSRQVDAGAGIALFSLSALREGDGIAGTKSLIEDENLTSAHLAAGVDWRLPVGPGQEISLGGSVGVALPLDSGSVADFSPLAYDTLHLGYAARDVVGSGDRLVVGLSLPQAVRDGTARFALPVAMAAGTTSFSRFAVPLRPAERQVDLSLSYGVPLQGGAELLFSAVRSFNAGNIAGEQSTTASVGWKVAF